MCKTSFFASLSNSSRFITIRSMALRMPICAFFGAGGHFCESDLFEDPLQER